MGAEIIVKALGTVALHVVKGVVNGGLEVAKTGFQIGKATGNNVVKETAKGFVKGAGAVAKTLIGK